MMKSQEIIEAEYKLLMEQYKKAEGAAHKMIHERLLSIMWVLEIPPKINGPLTPSLALSDDAFDLYCSVS